ncbi:uncharacterized protein EAF01_008409 [Botrytis porri]|uniref:Uncharacterized protein n=1 Tax=Botrytis porri TaxID=87229 RepID=A0A4Z1KXN9_9HELO|nr:uncharacterized protein EAF01_008409 [Botrytis porri]KAF7899196.1 hypothetical protein EAF01_008409 [Botrytis porri]TGO89226.1 hypothetical protein BPOR_0119g00130 [Botrytis porri]
MTNSENKTAKMAFDWVDDTNEAVAAGELPDLTSDQSDLDDAVKDTTKIQVNIGGVVASGIDRLKKVFYKKLGMLNKAKETESKEMIEAFELQEATLWAGGRRRAVKKPNPLREVMFA